MPGGIWVGVRCSCRCHLCPRVPTIVSCLSANSPRPSFAPTTLDRRLRLGPVRITPTPLPLPLPLAQDVAYWSSLTSVHMGFALLSDALLAAAVAYTYPPTRCAEKEALRTRCNLRASASRQPPFRPPGRPRL